MLFTTDWMKTLFPKGAHPDNLNRSIHVVEMDSRKLLTDGLFIPLLGERVDGHAFINQAYEQGAVATFWSEDQDIPTHLLDKMHFFLVDDPLKAMQKLAHAYRLEINPTVIGITGSNGKTTTKDITKSIMQTTYKTHSTIGNLNNHIGLPLTILSMPTDTEVLILEMGMNNFDEIHLLSTIAEPDYGCIVHIGESHIEHLHSREGIATAKLEIIDGFHEESVLLYDGDEPLLERSYPYKTITVGFGDTNETRVTNVHINTEHTTFHALGEEYSIPLLGKHHAKNASFALTLAKELGIEGTSMKQGLEQLAVTSMRFEQVPTNSGMTVINDAYNASPTSMRAAIDVVSQMKGFSTRILVLGDILELGEASEKYHRAIGKEIQSPITAVYTFGDAAKYIDEELSGNEEMEHFFVQTKEALLHHLQKYSGNETVILLKASRGIELESILPTLKTF